MSQLQVTGEAKIRDIQGPVVANDGVVTALDGAASQYVRGDGTLADFPTSTGGGSSVSYYLNSSVSQGTIGGVAYRQLSKDPIIGGGTDIAISANGYVASYITDANDPDVVIVPGGNFNCEFYFSVNNNTGNPTTYAELYKYDGTTFTLLGTSAGVPESINQGTTIAPYYFAIPVATAALALTDRLAIRIYVNVDGRTVTLHTENGHLCQVVTTLSKGMVSLNNLTDQSQFITTGTSGTNFAIVSSGDTHTFNLPVASATNTGKLSSTDWSTFNNKQNALTNPITGTGASGNVAYFDSTSSITSENSFNYDASTNRLGVNTTVPNATIGANENTDSGYSLLLKNGNSNYNGIGFATSSTYGNVIGTEKIGTAPARNLTLLNQSGYISITEAGTLGVNILNPNAGVDIYSSTTSSLCLHTANSGVTSTDGLRLSLFSNSNGVLRNNEGSLSMSSEGDFYLVTLGAENIRVNSANGFVGIGNPSTLPSLLTVNGGATITGLTTGQIIFPTSGGTLSGSSSLFWDNTNVKLGIGTTTLSTARVTITSVNEAEHLHLVGNVPALTFTNALSFTYYAGIGMATASNNFVTGSVQGDLALGAFNTSSILFYNNNTNTMRLRLDGSGAAIFSGSVTARGPKSQIVVDGNSVGAGISLTNTIVGSDRRNWLIGTEENVEGDFVIKRSTVSGGTANTTVLSLSRDGAATFSGALSGTSATFSSTATATAFIPSGSSVPTNGMYLSAANTLNFATNTTNRLSISSTGAATFSSSVTVPSITNGGSFKMDYGANVVSRSWRLISDAYNYGDFSIQQSTTQTGSTYADRLSISANGNVGIGVSNPVTAKLSIAVANSGSNQGGIDITNGVNASFNVSLRTDITEINAGGTGNMVFSNSSERMRITSGGNVGIGTSNAGARLTTRGVDTSSSNWSFFAEASTGVTVFGARNDGQVYAGEIAASTGTALVLTSGGYINKLSSSIRYKKDVQPIDIGLDFILSLNPVSYNLKDGDIPQVGFIAEDFPEDRLVSMSMIDSQDESKGYQKESVNYAQIVAPLVKAIQEQQAQIEELKELIKNK
jgi:trimeric autotransporter adhesin